MVNLQQTGVMDASLDIGNLVFRVLHTAVLTGRRTEAGF
jgi:hypothetical protein